ncbi:MAG: zf-HC2 domain-containing protein [Eubacteriales bacterium]|nr:zf-HC2 domain-containing protein [Eubacteriales bacterium]
MNCDIICDLLPLFAEGMASDKSRELVGEHLKGCPNCRKALAGLKAELPTGEQAALPLKKISRELKTRRLLTGLWAMFLALALATSILSALTSPRYAPYQAGLFTIHQAGGLLEVTVRDGYRANLISESVSREERGGIQLYSLEVFSYPLDKGRGQGELTLRAPVDQGSRAAVFYLEPDREDRLVYGPDPFPGGGRMTLPRLALAYYLALALIPAVFLGLLLLIFRKKEKARRVLTVLIGLPLSWIAGHLIIKGFTTISREMLRDFIFIAAAACFLFSAWVVRQGFTQRGGRTRL